MKVRFIIIFLIVTFILKAENKAFTWTVFPDGPNGTVNAVIVSGNYVYVGGSFTQAGGVACKNIARYNFVTSTWSAVSGGTSDQVYCLAIKDNDVYVGGKFTLVNNNSMTVNYIAKWNTVSESWSQVLSSDGGNGVNNYVKSIFVDKDEVIVGGGFTQAGNGTVVNFVAKLNTINNTWAAYGSGMSQYVRKVMVLDGVLYVVGEFTGLPGVDPTTYKAYYFAYYDTDNQWKSPQSPYYLSDRAYCLEKVGSTLFLGGQFSGDGTGYTTFGAIAKFDKTNNKYLSVGGGFKKASGYPIVNCLVNSGDYLYVGGLFETNSTSLAIYNNVCRINGTNSSYITLSGGITGNAVVYDMAISPTEKCVYVVGSFEMAGGLTTQNIAKLNDPVILPVELTAFTASTTNSGVKLAWSTATEQNNNRFEIERSLVVGHQSLVWGKVGEVLGNGNSNSTKNYSFTDTKATAGKYVYRLKQIDNDGKYEYSKEVEVTLANPTSFGMSQNYPNPFNPTTVLSYQIPDVVGSNGRLTVLLKIYDVLGKEVATLVNEKQNAGVYNLTFNTQNLQLASGMYIAKLNAGSFSKSIKMNLIK